MINNVVYSYLDKIINIVFVHYSEHSVFKKIVKLKYNTNRVIMNLVNIKQLRYYVRILEDMYKYKSNNKGICIYSFGIPYSTNIYSGITNLSYST